MYLVLFFLLFSLAHINTSNSRQLWQAMVVVVVVPAMANNSMRVSATVPAKLKPHRNKHILKSNQVEDIDGKKTHKIK